MKRLDVVRLILGGLVSAIIIYLIETVTNAVVLGRDWQDWSAIARTAFVMPSGTVSMIHWGLQTLIAGIAGTFIYAGIRTWVGANLRAAWISGVIVWAIGWLGMSMDKMAMGIEPHKMIHYNLLAALIACLLGQVVASFIYKDRAE
ncbi:MAG: hypothetical protein QM647_08385 [Asticcacaulis sp.]|uniref:hypothetical protein n=1 Tax=Asticcacaulis sp. TaxID=1872648 RepID=UPI0039E6E54F